MSAMTTPSNWKMMPIGDVCLKVTKGTTPTTIGGRFTDEGINFIKVETISEFGSIEESKLAFIDEESHELLKRSQLEANDVLFSIAGAIGRTYLVKEEDLPANINQALAIVRFNQDVVLPFYGFYALRSPYFQSQAFGRIVQCAQANVNLTQLSMSKIFIPPKIQQEYIVKILSSYDNLIENNRRRIQLLEQSARLFYREWFVHLRFPGHEHVRIIDGVPEGWKKGTITSLGQVITGKTPSTKEEDNYGSEIPFIKTPDMHGMPIVIETEQSLSEKGANTQVNKFIPEGSIMVTCIGKNVGVVSLNGYKAQTNQQINTVIPQKDSLRYYTYFALSDLKPMLEAIGGGATMPNINKTKFESLQVVVPSDSVLNIFDDFCQQAFKQMQNLLEQNKKLKEARDLLLPCLMNGEITV